MSMSNCAHERGAPPFNRKKVAVVTFYSLANELKPDEEVAARHIKHYLGRYDLFAVAPQGGSLDISGIETIRVPRHFFGSVQAHTSFVLGPRMYEMFSEYEYLLLHHLDALVFSDQLLEWCEAGYDYIGAPWWDDHKKRLIVGCGGFGLRRISAFLNMFRSRVRSYDPEASWKKFSEGRTTAERAVLRPLKYLKHLPAFNGVKRDLRNTRRQGFNEESFIIDRAHHYLPGFRIAPLADALRFGFGSGSNSALRLRGECFLLGVIPG
jgi:hypothetical protein